MIRRVTLDRLPQELQFPDELKGRIRYDADSQRLEFEGYMSKNDFDRLLRLHNDLHYQRALESLFQICVFGAPDEEASSRARLVLLSLAALALTAAGAATCALVLR